MYTCIGNIKKKSKIPTYIVKRKINDIIIYFIAAIAAYV